MKENKDVRNISEVKVGLERSFQKVIDYCISQDDMIFEQPIMPGKWSTAQNLEHLCSSTLPLVKAMNLPKIALRMSFGINNRKERTFDQLLDKYKKTLQSGVQAPAKFSPKTISNKQKVAMISRFRHAGEKLLAALKKWDEKSLSKYIVPHPALGKLTIREMLFFTIFHTEHHLKAVQKFKG